MRRLLRRLFNALTVLSLLLCVATVVLWVRSYCRPLIVRLAGSGREDTTDGGNWVPIYDGYLQPFLLTVEPGRLAARWESDSCNVRTLRWRCVQDEDDVSFETSLRLPTTNIGFHRPGGSGRDASAVEAAVPLWALALGSLFIPLVTVARRFRRSRPRGLCAICGYDLRASPGSLPRVRDGNTSEGGIVTHLFRWLFNGLTVLSLLLLLLTPLSRSITA